jgi:hypothetical protein
VKVSGVLLATAFTFLAHLLILPEAVQAEIIPVSPGESINAAIDRASDGDTILVQPGTYQEAIWLKGGILLKAQGGPGVTRLLGLPGQAVVTAVGFGTRTLDGFTLDGGYQSRAGVEAELYSDGALAITNCRIGENYGPGIDASLWGSLTRLALAHNVIAANAGPGLFVDAEAGSMLATENEIVENGGGGCSIYAGDSGAVELIRNQIEANLAPVGGGIALLAFWGGRIEVTGNRIGANTAEHGGGLDAVVIAGTLTVVNNVVHRNGAGEHGGLSIDARFSSYLECTQNTVVANQAPDTGAWIETTPDSSARIANNIFWANQTRDYAGPASHHSVIGTGNNGGEGNLSIAPHFYDPDAGDYRLTILSPCVDRGDTEAVPPSVATDASGRPRVRGNAVDPGAYEFVSCQQLLADLNAELSAMEENRLLGGWMLWQLRHRLNMADYFLQGNNGTGIWSLYFLRDFIRLVGSQSGVSIPSEAALRLEAAAREIYAQAERWGG